MALWRDEIPLVAAEEGLIDERRGELLDVPGPTEVIAMDLRIPVRSHQTRHEVAKATVELVDVPTAAASLSFFT